MKDGATYRHHLTRVLGQALEAIAAGDMPAALDALVAGWGIAHEDRLATLIRVVSARVSVAADSATVLGVGSSPTAHEAWLEVARLGRPRDLDRLVPTLAASNYDRCTERLQTVADRHDPRLGDAVVALLREPCRRSDIPEYWEAHFECLVVNADRHVREAIAELIPEYTAIFPTGVGKKVHKGLVRTLANVDEALARAETQPLAPEEEACVARLEARLAEGIRLRAHAKDEARQAAGFEEELLAAVYAAPDDDGPRGVYADWLVERDDPRGEFIQLQLADARGVLETSGKARMKALYDRFATRWMGDLHEVWRFAEFQRGFAFAVVVKPTPKAVASTERPAWRTVGRVTLADVKNCGAVVKLLTSPNLGLVREVCGLPGEALLALPALPLHTVTVPAEARHLLLLASALLRFEGLRCLRLSLDDGVSFDAWVDALAPTLSTLHELELFRPYPHLTPQPLRALLQTRIVRLCVRHGLTIRFSRAAPTAPAWDATIELPDPSLTWLFHKTVEEVVAWAEPHDWQPLATFRVAGPHDVSEAVRDRILAAFGDRFRVPRNPNAELKP